MRAHLWKWSRHKLQLSAGEMNKHIVVKKLEQKLIPSEYISRLVVLFDLTEKGIYMPEAGNIDRDVLVNEVNDLLSGIERLL